MITIKLPLEEIIDEWLSSQGVNVLWDSEKLVEGYNLNIELYVENKDEHITMIAGEASGADFLAKVFALDEYGDIEAVSYKGFPADWKKHGKAAGGIRNQQMLDEGKPDLVIAFPGGTGTADMIRRARKAGVEVVEVAG